MVSKEQQRNKIVDPQRATNQLNIGVTMTSTTGQQAVKDEEPKSRRTCLEFVKKYLFEGQALSESYQRHLQTVNLSELPWYRRILITHRRLVGIVLPALIFHFFWWSYFIKYDLWYLFKENYPISIMMVFGSLIAGMTSEGGGSVAFPVMTLAFNIKPSIARDFSLMIQSCGMVAAAFTIYFMKIHLEWRSLVFCTFGGLFGNILAIEVIDTALTPPQKKMAFVSLFFTFAFALFLLNRIHKRTTYKSIPEFNWWKALILIITGFFGGIFTGVTGSGIDICSFSILTLFFRVSEKTATPTSVALMAINTLIGAYWRLVMIGNVDNDAWEYVGVCLPIVVIGAPLGSIIGSHFHRQALAALNYITDTTALVSAFAIVPMTEVTIGIAVGIIVFGFAFYGTITWLGGRMMEAIMQREDKQKEQNYTKEQSTSVKSFQVSIN